MNKYIVPVQLGDETFYAYNYLDNDLSDRITIITSPGETIDLSRYFGNIDGATITGDFIDGTATDMSNISTKADAADGTHTGTVTLPNGTTLKFAVVFNPPYYGAYNIIYKDSEGDAPMFIAYNEDPDLSYNKGNKLIATGTYHADATADAVFTLAPRGEGFTISAQGQYLKSPNLSWYNHIMFSGNAADAGTYLAEELDVKGTCKLRSIGEGFNIVSKYDYSIMGNNNVFNPEWSTFAITPVTTYPFTVPASGLATLCLPFHVVLPTGIQAFDCEASDIAYDADKGAAVCYMQAIAGPGETLKSGTPALIKAPAGEYLLTITMDDAAARTSLPASLLCGNYLKQELPSAGEAKTFLLQQEDAAGTAIWSMQTSGTLAANVCRLEWVVPAEMGGISDIVPDFSKSTGIGDITASPKNNLIFNLGGQRLSAPRKGVNIIGNTKVIVN